MNINYQRQLDGILLDLSRLNKRPRLLLHACCAPCSSYCLEYLTPYFDISVYYYNPNIMPRGEYEARLRELERLVERLPRTGQIDILPGRYEPERFLEFARRLSHAPEGGERCRKCFELRLGATAEKAASLGADYFTTTLTISPMKDAQLLNAIGAEMSARQGVAWLPSDFKKRNGYRRSCELSREYGLYRQDYCGCMYSRMERDQRKLAQQMSPD